MVLLTVLERDWHVLTISLLGLAVLGGLFYLLFQISRGKWIGGGDVKLGFVLGLLVGGPGMSILVLFLASTAGTLVTMPLLVTGRAKRTSRIPFGPFLLLATFIVQLFGTSLSAWYQRIFL
jgi:prepilin signal peptidase PulO-like enzyme (type II secretory pathway)